MTITDTTTNLLSDAEREAIDFAADSWVGG